jgi:hypothetical protein
VRPKTEIDLSGDKKNRKNLIFESSGGFQNPNWRLKKAVP